LPRPRLSDRVTSLREHSGSSASSGDLKFVLIGVDACRQGPDFAVIRSTRKATDVASAGIIHHEVGPELRIGSG
jgi:hypothetical protein